MQEKLDEIDDILMRYEDWMHGEDGNDCTKARKLLAEVQKEIKSLERPKGE